MRTTTNQGFHPTHRRAFTRRAIAQVYTVAGAIVVCTSSMLWISLADGPHRQSQSHLAKIDSVEQEREAERLREQKIRPSTDCQACHKIDGIMNHPVDVVPSMPIPKHLPLSDGRVTCITCHDTAGSVELGSTGRGHTVSLRSSPSGAAFCAQCHTDFSNDAADMHARFGSLAHLKPQENGRPLRSNSNTPHNELVFDDQTQNCLSCHDDLVGPSAVHNDVNEFTRSLFGRSGGSSHPVGVPYPSTLEARDRNMRPHTTLDSRLTLFDGRLGCGTCHSVYSKEDSLLVMSNQFSRLCLACHND